MRTSSPTVIEYARDPQAAKVLRRCGKRVAASWNRAAASLLADQPRTRTLLGEPVEQIIAQLVSALSEGRQVERSAGTGGNGTTQLQEMLMGYQLLREVALEQLAAEMESPLGAEELAAVCAAIDASMREHVADLQERQIRDHQAVEEAHGRYMSYLSHDLRGTINGVLLMMEVLRRELAGRPDMADSLEDVTLMRQSLLEGVALLERHVRADRLRRGRVELHPERIALSEVVDDVIGQFTEPARQRHVELAAEIPPRAQVRSDRALLRQVLEVLVDNAVRYGEKGTITIRAARAEGGGWILAVHSTGRTIDDQRLALLLDPIRRGLEREKGLGLVLAVYGARNLGGSVSAEADPAGGNIFRLHLPAEPA